MSSKKLQVKRFFREGNPLPRRSLATALSVLFIDNFGTYIVFPLFSYLLFTKKGGFLPENSSFTAAFHSLTLLIIAFPLMQLLSAPLIGFLGDTFGRRRGFFITLIGEGIGYSLSALSIYIESFTLLLASRLFTGFFAGNLSICLAVIADYTSCVDKRTKIFGKMTGILGISFAAGVSIGGLFSSRAISPFLSPALPFWIAALLALINGALVAIFFKDIPFPEKEPQQTKTPLIALIKGNIALFLFALGYIPSMQLLSLFLLNILKMNHFQISVFFVVLGIIWVAGSSFINSYFIKLLSTHTRTLTTLFFSALFLLLSLLVKHTLFFYPLFALYVLSSVLAWTGLTTTISFLYSEKNRGRLMGVTQSVLIAASLAGPLLAAKFSNQTLNTPYYSSVAFLFSAFVLFYIFKKFI